MYSYEELYSKVFATGEMTSGYNGNVVRVGFSLMDDGLVYFASAKYGCAKVPYIGFEHKLTLTQAAFALKNSSYISQLLFTDTFHRNLTKLESLILFNDITESYVIGNTLRPIFPNLCSVNINQIYKTIQIIFKKDGMKGHAIIKPDFLGLDVKVEFYDVVFNQDYLNNLQHEIGKFLMSRG